MFSKRDQDSGKSVIEYVAVLRRLPGNCAFGEDKFPLVEMLRNLLVFGIGDGVVHQRLVAEKELTFQAAYELAVTAETTAKQQKALRATRHEREVQREMTARLGPQAMKEGAEESGGEHATRASHQFERRYFRCLGNHRATSCRFKNAVCFSCSQKGHIAKTCRGPRTQEQGQLDETAVAAGAEHSHLSCISQVTNGAPKYVLLSRLAVSR